MICINCSQHGHTFSECKYPIISYGIIGYHRKYPGPPGLYKPGDDLRYLLVQRKDSIGFLDFVRGKYDQKTQKDKVLEVLVGEMTLEEKLKLLNCDFDKIWSDMWINKNSRIYKNDYEIAKKKFNNIDIEHMIKSSIEETKWLETEFSIPKGRKNNQEYTIACAIREFSEETGLNRQNIRIINNYRPLEEIFYGSNGVVYKHVYYIAEINTDKIPDINFKNVLQAGEIKYINWFSYKEAMNVFRNYESTKRAVIHQVHKLLTNKFN
jgi:8-oxo-dGTP pyrophosphatase MutT (NUDIX family)